MERWYRAPRRARSARSRARRTPIGSAATCSAHRHGPIPRRILRSYPAATRRLPGGSSVDPDPSPDGTTEPDPRPAVRRAGPTVRRPGPLHRLITCRHLRGRSSAGRALDWQSRGSWVRVPSPPPRKCRSAALYGVAVLLCGVTSAALCNHFATICILQPPSHHLRHIPERNGPAIPLGWLLRCRRWTAAGTVEQFVPLGGVLGHPACLGERFIDADSCRFLRAEEQGQVRSVGGHEPRYAPPVTESRMGYATLRR